MTDDHPHMVAEHRFRELAEECDRLRTELAKVTAERDEARHMAGGADTVAQIAISQNESKAEMIKHLRESLAYAKVTIENLKANQCPSWARDAKRVSDARRNGA